MEEGVLIVSWEGMGRGWWCSGQGCPGREWEVGGGVVARGVLGGNGKRVVV